MRGETDFGKKLKGEQGGCKRIPSIVFENKGCKEVTREA